MWQESDADDLFKYASDPDVGERAGWPPHNTKEDSLMVIRDIFSNDHTWALELKETGHVQENDFILNHGRSEKQPGRRAVKPERERNRGLVQEIERSVQVHGVV